MYDRFSDRARMVIQLANQEAQRLGHECIGTEHILLGLVKEGRGIAGKTLLEAGVDLRKIRDRLTAVPANAVFGKLPLVPTAKRLVERANEEARRLGHSYVGTEHLLLAMLTDFNCVGACIIKNIGASLTIVREAVLDSLSAAGTSRDDSLPKAEYVTVSFGKAEPFTLGKLEQVGADWDDSFEPVASLSVNLGRLQITADKPDNMPAGEPIDSRHVRIFLDGKEMRNIEEMTITIKAGHVVMVRTNAMAEF